MSLMKKHGHDVILGVPGNGFLNNAVKNININTHKFFLPKIINTRLVIGKIRFFNIFAAIYNLIILFISSLSLFILIKDERPDIVHSNQILISIAAGLACRIAKVPCIWHIRENPAKHISDVILKTFGLFGYFLANKIIVNSQYTAKIFHNTLMQRKIIVIPIGIEISKNKNSTEKNIRKNNLSDKIISIFGRLIPMKGHEVLIESMKILKSKKVNFKLNIYGDYNDLDLYYLSLVSLINRLNLSSKIRFCGFKSNIQEAMNSSDIIVSSSTEAETFGRTIVEAMLVGKPVIATRVGAHPEIIEDGVSGFLVQPNDPKDLAKKIEILFNDKNLAYKIGETGKERSEEYFTLKKYIDRLEVLYQNLSY